MKFNCGLTHDEKHKLKLKRMAEMERAIELYEKPYKQWHKWYAWKPVRIGSGDFRWFEYVERIGVHHNGCNSDDGECYNYWSWEYRAIDKGER